MIGTLEEARIAATIEIVWDNNADDYFLSVEGWKYIGGGSYRHAMLSPSGVVYKRDAEDAEPDTDEWAGNALEWNAYQIIKAFLEEDFTDIRLPVTHYWEHFKIIAMEFIDGIPSWDMPFDLSDRVYRAGHKYGMNDWCSDNVKFKNGIAYVVDFGM